VSRLVNREGDDEERELDEDSGEVDALQGMSAYHRPKVWVNQPHWSAPCAHSHTWDFSQRAPDTMRRKTTYVAMMSADADSSYRHIECSGSRHVPRPRPHPRSNGLQSLLR
jgi:hypothetical protein